MTTDNQLDAAVHGADRTDQIVAQARRQKFGHTQLDYRLHPFPHSRSIGPELTRTLQRNLMRFARSNPRS